MFGLVAQLASLTLKWSLLRMLHTVRPKYMLIPTNEATIGHQTRQGLVVSLGIVIYHHLSCGARLKVTVDCFAPVVTFLVVVGVMNT